MNSLRHDNHGDVGLLSAMVELVPAHRQTLFAAAVIGHDLMHGPWWLRTMTWTVRTLRGWTVTTTWYLFLERIGRGYAQDIVSNFASHIVTGKDISDRRSVGGLNQQEIEITLQLLRNVLSGVEVHPTYRTILDQSSVPGTEIYIRDLIWHSHELIVAKVAGSNLAAIT